MGIHRRAEYNQAPESQHFALNQFALNASGPLTSVIKDSAPAAKSDPSGCPKPFVRWRHIFFVNVLAGPNI